MVAGCARGCAREPPGFSVGRIVLDVPAALDEVEGARERVRAGVRERLDDEDTVRLDESARDFDYVLRVGADLLVGTNEEGLEGRPVQVTLRPTRNATEYQTIGRGLPIDDLAASVLTGFDDAWTVVGEMRWLDVATDERLIVSLSHPDARLRDFAIQRLGERKSRAAVPALCQRLTKEPRPELVLRAVGALVSIGDNRAAEPLIELTRQKDPQFVVQVVFALASLGGPTVEGYLVTLAGGHPVEAVRQAAEDALKELTERANRKSVPD